MNRRGFLGAILSVAGAAISGLPLPLRKDIEGVVGWRTTKSGHWIVVSKYEDGFDPVFSGIFDTINKNSSVEFLNPEDWPHGAPPNIVVVMDQEVVVMDQEND